MPKIEVSNGEIFDKLSILEVKHKNIKGQDKLAYVAKEYGYLKNVVKTITSEIDFPLECHTTYIELRDINFRLWDIEDEIRSKEVSIDFGDRFIELSRLIYTLNDQRFKLKNKINDITNSSFKEQKGHKTCEEERSL